MKKVLAMLAAVLIALAVCAAAAESAEMAWGMTRDQVVEMMGEEPNEEETADNERVIRYDEVPFGNYTAKAQMYAFRDDRLFCTGYAVTDPEKTVFSDLAAQMGEAFGEAADDPSLVVGMLPLIGYPLELDAMTLGYMKKGGLIDYAVWTPDGDSDVVLLFLRTDEVDFTFAGFIQKSEQQ